MLLRKELEWRTVLGSSAGAALLCRLLWGKWVATRLWADGLLSRGRGSPTAAIASLPANSTPHWCSAHRRKAVQHNTWASRAGENFTPGARAESRGRKRATSGRPSRQWTEWALAARCTGWKGAIPRRRAGLSAAGGGFSRTATTPPRRRCEDGRRRAVGPATTTTTTIACSPSARLTNHSSKNHRTHHQHSNSTQTAAGVGGG